MPSILPAAVIGSSAIGAGVSLSAADKAAKASQNATDQSIAAQQQQYQQTRTDLAPFMQGGYAANNALMTRLGLAGTPAGAGTTGVVNTTPVAANMNGLTAGAGLYAPGSTTPAPGGLTDAQAQQLLSARPDVMAEYQRASSTADRNSPVFLQKGLDSPTNFARWWYSSNGGAAQYQPQSTAPQTPATVPAAPQTGGPTPTAYVPTGTYGNPTNPTYTAPAPFSYTQADYTASPAYQYTVDQAMKGVTSQAAATGARQSGATLKALQDRAANLAYGDFSNERAFANANYDTNRAFNLQQYQDQRNYLSGRYDTETNNLFNLYNTGANAAAGVGSAGQNATNSLVNALNNNAGTQANAGLAGANAVTGLLGSGVNALAYNRGYGGAGYQTGLPQYTGMPTGSTQMNGLY